MGVTVKRRSVFCCVLGHIHVRAVCLSASPSPGTARALPLPDCTVAAVVVAVGQLLVGARGGGASFGLGRGALAGVEGRTGTGPTQGGLQGA